MKSGLIESDITAIAVIFTCCFLVWQRFTTDAWKRRWGALGSALIKPPAYRALFVLVLIGVVLVATLPEAAFLLPALDAVGLDVVTVLAALELRHYWASVARLLGISAIVAGFRRVQTKPELWPYQGMWLVIWVKMLSGTMRVSSPAQV